jgi:hypothetical protein
MLKIFEEHVGNITQEDVAIGLEIPLHDLENIIFKEIIRRFNSGTLSGMDDSIDTVYL